VCHEIDLELLIMIIIAPLTIVSEDQWEDLECLYEAKQLELMEAYSQTLGRFSR